MVSFSRPIIAAATFLSGVEAHSWLIKINGAAKRGGNVGSDSVLERLFCPEPTLAECQPPSKHGITLSQDAMRPCRRGQKSNPMAHVENGGTLQLHWAGNGHANSQSDGTCVRIGITPYQDDPSFPHDFQFIGGCIPYHKNGSTSANIPLPAGYTDGEYTVLWFWDFDPFWYASCADIHVGNGSGSGSPSVPSVPDPVPNHPHPEPEPEPVPSQPTNPGSGGYHSDGCGELPASFCANTFGGGSYCKSWQKDSCGRSVCHGQSGLGACGSSSPSVPSVPSIPSVPSVPSVPSSPTGPGVYHESGCAGLDSEFCRDMVGSGSYCKTWNRDSCGRSICHGDTNYPPCRRLEGANDDDLQL